jgi:hypothetical protein
MILDVFIINIRFKYMKKKERKAITAAGDRR